MYFWLTLKLLAACKQEFAHYLPILTPISNPYVCAVSGPVTINKFWTIKLFTTVINSVT